MIKGPITRLAFATGAVTAALRMQRGSPLILMYHGVTRTPPGRVRNRDGKHLHADVFGAQIETVLKYREIVDLGRMVDDLLDGRPVANQVAITFDDGYENNFSVAAPILQRYRATATVFLATGFIGTGRWMWTDRLENALERTTTSELPAEVLGSPYALRGDEEKWRAYREIKARLKKLPQPKVADAVDRVCAALDVGTAEPFGDYRFMSWDQAREWARIGFGVGAHTMSHAILSRVGQVEAVREMLGSRDQIEREIGRCSPVFAYPNGKTGDYGDAVIDICRGLFRAAVTTHPGFARAKRPFELNRCGAPLTADPAGMSLLLLRGG